MIDMTDLYNSLLKQNGIDSYVPPSSTLPSVNIPVPNYADSAGSSVMAPNPMSAPTTPAIPQTQPAPTFPTITAPSGPTFAPMMNPSSMFNALEMFKTNPRAFGVNPSTGGTFNSNAKPVDGNTDYDDIVNKYSSAYGVSPDLMRRVISAESSGRPNIVSSAGAKGLTQVTDDSFTDYGPKNGNIFDPDDNINAGTKELSTYLKKYNGNVPQALSAYNWGPANVDRLLKQNRFDISNLPQETQDYLKKLGAV